VNGIAQNKTIISITAIITAFLILRVITNVKIPTTSGMTREIKAVIPGLKK
jgi:hypothetical protein